MLAVKEEADAALLGELANIVDGLAQTESWRVVLGEQITDKLASAREPVLLSA